MGSGGIEGVDWEFVWGTSKDVLRSPINGVPDTDYEDIQKMFCMNAN